MGIQCFSIFKPVYFFQHLVCYWPHQRNEDLYHPRRDALPPPVEYFAQAVEKLPEILTSEETIRDLFQTEGHKRHFINLYPLSAHKLTIFNILRHYICSRHQHYIRQRRAPIEATQNAPSWTSFHTLLGKPGTGKSQVLVRIIDYLVHTKCRVLVPTPIALLANRYQAIFANDVTCDTVHAAF